MLSFLLFSSKSFLFDNKKIRLTVSYYNLKLRLIKESKIFNSEKIKEEFKCKLNFKDYIVFNSIYNSKNMNKKQSLIDQIYNQIMILL